VEIVREQLAGHRAAAEALAIRPINGLPSSGKGIRPAHVRAIGTSARKGRTEIAWSRFTSMPLGSGVVSYPISSRSPPKMISPLRRWRP